jgi:hypothetical protein
VARSLGRSVFLAAGFAAGFVSLAAMAQDEPERNVSVTDRFRPDYSPIGIRQGGFLILPQLHVAETYDDNILAVESGKKDDFITTVEPSIRARSTWSQHALNFVADAQLAYYADNSGEDHHNYGFGADGRIDITRDSFIDGGVLYRRFHEERTSADDAGGGELTEYTTLAPRAGFFQRWNRASLKVDGNAQKFDFDDVTQSSGAVVDNDDRDRTRYLGSARLGYEIVPQYEAFLRAEYNQVDYDEAMDSDGVNRDSDGFEVTAGLRIDVTNVLFGDVFVGYRRQSYDAATLDSIDGATYGGALTWNPSRLTTVKALIERTVEETTQTDASGYFSTRYGVSVDHELLRNLIVGAATSYTVNQYKGNGRDDDIVEAGIYTRYLMHRNLYLSARYGYEQRESNVANADYDKNVFMLRLETQF